MLTQPRIDHVAIARDFARRPDDWPFAPRFDPGQRWYGRLAAADDHEVWLLTWLPGQGTDLHDHGGSAGAFVVVSGAVTELTVAPAGPARLVPRTLGPGTARWFGRHHVHQVVNKGDRPAVTVHVYGPALTALTRYRIERDRLVLAGVDQAGVQW